MLGYFPMAVAFGVLAADPIFATLSGIFVYAGASQFLSVKMLEGHASLYEIALSTFVLNVRHVFYSLQFASEYAKLPRFQKWYSAFALTDETFAVLAAGLTKNPEQTRPLVFWVSFFNHLTWINGCLTGALLKHMIGSNIKGLDFLLVAVFIVLLVENLKRGRPQRKILGSAFIALFTGSVLASFQVPGWLFFGMALMLVYGLVATSPKHGPIRPPDNDSEVLP